jgi:hypothetical protein
MRQVGNVPKDEDLRTAYQCSDKPRRLLEPDSMAKKALLSNQESGFQTAVK